MVGSALCLILFAFICIIVGRQPLLMSTAMSDGETISTVVIHASSSVNSSSSPSSSSSPRAVRPFATCERFVVSVNPPDLGAIWSMSRPTEVHVECQYEYRKNRYKTDTSYDGPSTAIQATSSNAQYFAPLTDCTFVQGKCTAYFEVRMFGTYTLSAVSLAFSIGSVTIQQTPPVIWTTGPMQGETIGGARFVLNGINFLDPTAPGCGAPLVEFVDVDSGNRSTCTLVSHTWNKLECDIPPGEGAPEVVVTICGVRQVHLPRFPTDFYFRERDPVQQTHYPYCIDFRNPWDDSGHTWGDNYYCTKDYRSDIGLKYWYPSCCTDYDPVPQWYRDNYHMFQILNPAEYWAWPNMWMGVPKESPYDIVFTCDGLMEGKACAGMREGSDPYWADGNCYICASLNVPYPPEDGMLLYHYAPPSITSVTPPTGPTAGGIVITFVGTSFGFNPSITIGGKDCPITGAHNHTFIQCILPQGQSMFNAIIITVAGQVSSSVNFAYDPPVIQSISPGSGPTEGGTTLVIDGYNFGFVEGGLTNTGIPPVTIGGASCAVSAYSNTQITCTLPPGQGSDQPTYVNTDFQQNVVPFPFDYNPPSIDTVTPSSAETSGGITLDITGGSFGFSSTVTVDGRLCPPTGSGQTHFHIQCQLPEGQGKDLIVDVKVDDQYSNPKGVFSYDPPRITSVTPKIAASGSGIFLTLDGFSFGLSGTVTVNNVLCDASDGGQWTHRIVSCALPVGSGSHVPVQLTTGGQTSNIGNFSYAPIISSIGVAAGQAAWTEGGATLIVTGTGFSTPAYDSAAVSINGKDCPILTRNETQITCTLPAGWGTLLPAVVSVDGFDSNSFPFSYSPPIISSVTPLRGPTVGGIDITLSGHSFGSSIGSTTVTLASKTCAVKSVSYQEIVCTVGSGSGANRPLVVTVQSQSSASFPWSYAAPNVTAISRSTGPTLGGYPITLYGYNFATSSATGIATVGGTVVGITFRNESQISFLMPIGQGDVQINVIIDSQSSNSVMFSYDPPSITSVSPLNGATKGGYLVTFDGNSFGTSGTICLNALCSVTCPLDGDGWGQSHIQCSMPEGDGTGHRVFIISGGKASNNFTFNYDPPLLYTATPSSMLTSGNQVLAITGSSFGVSGLVKIGSSTCDQAGPGTSWDHSLIQCLVKEGQGSNLLVQVIVGGQVSNTTTFSYLLPTIDTLLPNHGATTGGYKTTILGSSFGLSAITTFGPSYGDPSNQVCQQVGIGQNHKQIECLVPEGQGLSTHVFVNVSNQVATSEIFKYDPPFISSVTPANVATDGSTVVTLTGRNFGLGTNYELQLNGVPIPSASVSFINHTQIIVTAPRGTGRNRALRITVADQLSIDPSPLIQYIAPNLTSISGCDADVFPQAIECNIGGGSTLLLKGTNFGNNNSVVSVSVGGKSCDNVVITTDDTELTCTLPASPMGGFNLPVTITVDGQSDSEPWLSYIGPVIFPQTLVLGTTPGSNPSGSVQLTSDPLVSGTPVDVTFSGKNFGSVEGDVTITYGLVGKDPIYSCPLINGSLTSSSGTDSVSCQVGAGVGQDLVFTIKVGFLVSPQGTDTLTYMKPVIVPTTIRDALDGTKADTYTGLYSSGDTIYFDAEHVGNDWSVVSVTYASASNPTPQQCISVQLTPYATYTTIRCTTQTGTGSGYHFTITALSHPSDPGTDTYNYVVPPTIESVSGCSDVENTTVDCSTLGGELLTIIGTNFGASAVAIRIGSTPCLTPQYIDPTKMTCVAPAGSGLLLGVTVLRSTLFSQPFYGLSYRRATIDSISGCTDVGSSTTRCARTGGTTITVTGDDFASPAPIVLVGGSPCDSVVADSSQPNKRLTCNIRSGTQTDLPVLLIQAGGPQTTSTQTLSYAPCPAGSYASEGQVECQPCLPGFYQDSEGQAGCKSCPDGEYSSSPNAQTCDACPVGTYSRVNPVTGAGASNCTACGAGFYNSAEGQASCTPCEAGRFSNGTEFKSCIPCSMGYYQPSPQSTECLPCAAGEYVSYEGALACEPCPAGTRTETGSTLAATSCVDCDPGYHASAPRSTSCDACTTSKYAPSYGMADCIQCDAGTFSNTSALSACYDCAPGSHSSSGAISCSDCGAGRYNPSWGQSSCLKCPSGTASSSLGMIACTPCIAGRYSDGEGALDCTDCGSGKFTSVNGSVICEECPVGRFADGVRFTECTQCGKGYYQPETGQIGCLACQEGQVQGGIGQASCRECDAGLFTNDTAMSQCLQCPPGQYSKKSADGSGAASCVPCDAGSYTSTWGQASCSKCPIGFFTNQTGSTACERCPEGYAAKTQGRSTCSQCEPGRYAVGTGNYDCLPCDFGTANPNWGQSSCSACKLGYHQSSQGQASCTPCSPGRAASEPGSRSCSTCGVGEYMPEFNASACWRCAAGRYALDVEQTQCAVCEKGKAQPLEGQAGCNLCEAGKFANDTQMTSCLGCAVGTATPTLTPAGNSFCPVCEPGSMAPLSGSVSCVKCPAGSYSANNGSGTCLQCDQGKYAPEAGSTECMRCPAGSAASTYGSVSCTPCSPGTFAPSTGLITCLRCAKGQHQPSNNATTCIDCPVATYSDVFGQASCKVCSLGSAPMDANNATGGTNNVACAPCPIGTYLDEPLASCKLCPIGRSNQLTGVTQCAECGVGRFQDVPGGNDSCIACPLGTSQPFTGQSNCTACDQGSYAATTAQPICTLCAVGTWTKDIGRNRSCELCPTGSYQPESGQSECIPCPAKTASSSPGVASCGLCPPGSANNETGMESCPLCPKGKYQPEIGSATCEECPTGRHADVEGLTICTFCEVGHFANVTGLTDCYPCPKGSVQRVPGATACTECGTGEYMDTPGQAECLVCGQGEYQPNNGSVKCLKCPAGSTQTLTGQSTCTPCPNGTYTEQDGAVECQLCKAGRFANTTGLSECYSCSSGRFQPSMGEDSCRFCSLGTYSIQEGSTSCIDCEAGKTTAQYGTSICSECDTGRYQPTPGQESCLFCPPATATNQTGQTICGDCQPGTFSNSNGSLSCDPCPIGRAQPLSHQTSCQLCEPGYYAPVEGLAACLPCGEREYQPGYGNSSCLDCPPGRANDATGQAECKLCEPGYHTEESRRSQCDPCPAGHYADGNGTITCAQCPPGHAQRSSGQSSCDVCAPGRAMSGYGAEECSECDIGTYQPDSGQQQCLDCEPGTVQPSTGMAECQKCNAGRHQPAPRQSECRPCDPGSYSNHAGAANCTLCSAGTFMQFSEATSCQACANGTAVNVEGYRLPCPSCQAGKFSLSLEGQAECTDCSPGWHQPLPGLSYCEPCEIGTFMSAPGSAFCQPCQAGRYGPTQALEQCLSCQVGRAQSETGSTNCSICPIASYADVEGEEQCSLCPPGKYGIQPEAKTCEPCGVGFYQDTFNQTECKPCGIGRFGSGTGLSRCSDCFPGTYNPGEQKTACLQCEPGKYQNLTGATHCELCPITGYSSSNNTIFCSSIPVGHYDSGSEPRAQPHSTLSAHHARNLKAIVDPDRVILPGSMSYTPCPIGTFQSNLGSTTCIDCLSGHYCPGQKLAMAEPCPAGTYTNQTAQSSCESCEAGTYQPEFGKESCLGCAPGYSSSGRAERCEVCEEGKVTDQYRSPSCIPCPDNSQPDFARQKCECNAGLYMPYYTPNSNVFTCMPCPIGGDCTQSGTAWYNIQALPGYWRANNHTLNFYECFIRSYCPGGPASAQHFDDSYGGPSSKEIESYDRLQGELTPYPTYAQHNWADPDDSGCLFLDSATPCTENRCGIMCSFCEPGYQSEVGGTCQPCPSGAGSYVMLVFIALIIIALMILQFYIILRADRELLNEIGTGNTAAGVDLSELDDEDEDELSDSEEESDEYEDDDSEEDGHAEGEEGVKQKRKRREKDVSASNRSHSHSSSDSASGSSSDSLSDTNTDTDGETDTDGGKTGTDKGTDGEMEPDPTDPPSEPENEDPLANINLASPAPVKDDLTHKLKIFLGFLQIMTNISSGLDMQWPATFKSFMTYFSVVNFDFILSSVTSSDCIGGITYYRKYLIITLVPIAIFFLVMIFWRIPHYFDLCCFRHATVQSKMRSKMKFWKLFLYVLFLIYPGVSSTVLRLYICKDIDGQGYLLTDLRVRCHTQTWSAYTLASIPLILLYPVGIPLFFFVLLRTNKEHLHDKRVQAQLGFLYSAYTAECWWFEMADSIHKLTVTSLLAFFPYDAQLPFGLATVIFYLALVLRINPYLRKSDDLFALICQVEIFLLLLVGYIFRSLPVDSAFSAGDDAAVSAALIIITVAVFCAFMYQMIRIGHKTGKELLARFMKKRQKEKEKAAKAAAKKLNKSTRGVGDNGGEGEGAVEMVARRPKKRRELSIKPSAASDASGSVSASASGSVSESRSSAASSASASSSSGSDSDDAHAIAIAASPPNPITSPHAGIGAGTGASTGASWSRAGPGGDVARRPRVLPPMAGNRPPVAPP